MPSAVIKASRIVELNAKNGGSWTTFGDWTKFIKFGSKFNDGKFSTKWGNILFSTDGGESFSQRQVTFVDEVMASIVSPATEEDATEMTKALGFKNPIKCRTQLGAIGKPVAVIKEFKCKVDTDQKTGALVGPKPGDDQRSYLFMAMEIVQNAFNATMDKRIADNLIIDKGNRSLKEKFPDALPLKTTRLCTLIQSRYSDECKAEARRDQPIANRILRINLPFGDDNSAKIGVYFKNDIPLGVKNANLKLPSKKQTRNLVPYTFTYTKDGELIENEPISNFNVHRIPMNTSFDGAIRLSICCSSQGISVPRAVTKIIATEGERSSVSTDDIYGDSDSEEEDAKSGGGGAAKSDDDDTAKSDDDDVDMDALGDALGGLAADE